jgi:hypothetical protein
MPGYRGIQPDLGLVQAEAVFPELEAFLHGYVGSRWCLMRRSIM